MLKISNQMLSASSTISRLLNANQKTLTFYNYLKESFGGEYHMYQIIPLRSCDYLYKVTIEINVVTDEGNSRNEI